MTDALVAAIEEDPYDIENYRVYADWLQANGDPRGELIAMWLLFDRLTDMSKQAQLSQRIEEHTATHALASETVRRHAREHRFGFVHSLEFGYDDDRKEIVATIREALAHPSTRFLVQLRTLSFTDHQEVADALAELVPRTLRSLQVGTWDSSADFTKLVSITARLERLDIGGPAPGISMIDLPRLRWARLPGTSHAAICSATWPRVEALEIVFAPRPQKLEHFAPLLARTDLPELTRLALTSSTFAGELVRRLSATPIGRQLVDLDLSFSDLDDDAARAWAANPPPKRLAVLRAMHTNLTQAGVVALRAVADRVIARAGDE